jgi:hypothetical protein
MRGRRLILGAVAVLAAVLGPAPAAQAAPPVIDLKCTSLNNRINCEVKVTSDIPYTLEWFGGPLAYLARDKETYNFRCFTGIFNFERNVTVQVKQQFVPTPFSKTVRLRCVDDPVRISSTIFCQAELSFGLPGGNYFACDTLWPSDGTVATVRWHSPQAQQQPVVTVNQDEGWTTATFNCNAPGEADPSFFAYVAITTSSGTVTTPATIPCGW